MMKILVLEPQYFDAASIKKLKTIGVVTAKRMKRNELLKEVKDFDILVVRIETKLDKELLSRAPRLKAIGSATTGLNHIDVGYAKKRNIAIFNLHGAHTIPTAQHTMALMLSLTRNIPWAHISLSRGEWKRYRFIGTQLDGKTLGIIGLGKIGSTVCEYAKAFGMNVIYYDPYVDSKAARRVSLNTLLRSSDIITIHAALNRTSSNELNKKEISLIKRGAYLINTARAEIIDYRSMLKALKSGRLAGAAMDVFMHEPISDHEKALLEYAKRNANLIITPHLGASTKEAMHHAGMEIACDLAKAFGRNRK